MAAVSMETNAGLLLLAAERCSLLFFIGVSRLVLLRVG